MPFARPLLAPLALASSWAIACWGCAPRVSTAALGLGPLAVAEQSVTSAERSAERTKRARQPHLASPAPAAVATKTDPKEDAEDKPEDDVSEVSEADTAASKEPPAFAGLFAGKDVATYRISGQPERQELDDKAKIRIESDSATQLRVVLINTTDGSDMCELSAEIQGNSAQLDGGQPCFTAEGEGAIQAELNSGTVTLAGDRLSMTAEGTLSGTLGEQEFEGSLSYSFKGKRQ